MTSISPSLDEESASPETLAKIARARTLSGDPTVDEPALFPYGSISELLAKRAAQTPNAQFLTYYEDTERASSQTYAEFDFSARTLAAAMVNDLKVTRGSRIATLMVNDLRTVAIYFAAWCVGATVVPINISEDDSRIAFILENSEVQAAFVMPDQCERLERLAPRHFRIAFQVQVGGEPFGDFVAYDRLMSNSEPVSQRFDVIAGYRSPDRLHVRYHWRTKGRCPRPSEPDVRCAIHRRLAQLRATATAR